MHSNGDGAGQGIQCHGIDPHVRIGAQGRVQSVCMYGAGGLWENKTNKRKPQSILFRSCRLRQTQGGGSKESLGERNNRSFFLVQSACIDSGVASAT